MVGGCGLVAVTVVAGFVVVVIIGLTGCIAGEWEETPGVEGGSGWVFVDGQGGEGGFCFGLGRHVGWRRR